MSQEIVRVIDERGALCPLPVISLGRAIAELPPASVVELLADDPAAAHDVPAWCGMRGAELLGSQVEDGVFRFTIRSAG